MKQQQIPQGYKLTEVGIIPEDWEVKSIGQFTSCIAGGTPSTRITSYWGGNHPWMSSGELHCKFIYDVKERITDEGLINSSAKYIPSESVLMGLAGQGKTRGTVAINKIKLCTNQSIAAILPNKDHITAYLFYNLENRYGELRGLSTGDGGRGGLNLTIIKNINLPFPNIIEQTAIANALSDIDALINQLKKLIVKKQAIKTATMQQLLTGKTRLPAFAYREDGNLKGTKQSELGEIPEDWETRYFNEVFKFKQGLQMPIDQQSLDNKIGMIRFIRIVDLTCKDEPIRYIIDPGKDYHINKNDLFMVRYGAPGLIGFGYEGVIANNLFRLISKVKIEELFYYFYLIYIHSKIVGISGSSTMPAVNFNSLNNVRIRYLPNLREQITIANILSDMDKEISTLEKRLAKTELIKQGMMQELLTGKTRLI